jgi:hypothetical protein
MNVPLKRRALLQISIAATLLLGGSIYYSCSFAEADRPSRGAIEFGAKNEPKVTFPRKLRVSVPFC